MTNEEKKQIEELVSILEDVIHEKIPIHLGCCQLSGLYHSGNPWVWSDFDEYYSKLNDIPLPNEYGLWNEEALNTKLTKLDEYKNEVLRAAQQLLNELKVYMSAALACNKNGDGDSGKNVFLLTGKPRMGKSTLIKNMIHRLGSERCGGFYTEEIRDDNERIGFKCVAVDGGRLEIASIKNNSTFKIGRYGVDVKGFEDFVIPLLESSLQSKKVIVIDEIGFMQMLSLPFQEWIRKIIFDHQHVVLGTVPVDSHTEIDKIKNHFRVKIIHINEDNRDTIADEIMQMILTKIE
ncbi:nucleoside-triphosphatase [Paenibacillus azoreducens]|uniref:AAA+ ATPase domain-containing protein n=1 Tax=Paenibacillus azoreducens TaxID=116718 RepID=A0A919YHP4_9BACL|nr:nucleoside-triphosphatase [Paenibacillus azoreducens]GIO51407.1 hypothetical protein J34TS1_61720 [Paenibacillus azoreducens]